MLTLIKMPTTNKLIPRATIGAIIFNKNGEILLLRSKKWHNRHIAPCGHVEFGEKLTAAVKREVWEETGLRVSDIKLIRVGEMISSTEYFDKKCHFVSLNYSCLADSDEVKLNKEAESYLWLKPLGALKLKLDSLTREAIEKSCETRDALPKNQIIGVSAFIAKNNKVLLVQRAKDEEFAPLHWELPGGKLEYGEKTEIGVAREIFEETGLKIKIIAPYSTFSCLWQGRHFVDIQYFCRALSAKIKLSAEHDEYFWAAKAQIKKMLITKEMRGAILKGFDFIK
jgi:nucleoside triphosphatase